MNKQLNTRISKPSLIQKLIDDNRLSRRACSHKCHNLSNYDLICLFCYCPYYEKNIEHPEGACKINKISREWHYSDGIDSRNRRVLNCTNCTYMHKEEGVEEFLKVQSTKFLEDLSKKSPKKIREDYEKKFSMEKRKKVSQE